MEKQRYNSKGEGLWLVTSLSKWLSMRSLGNWNQEWTEDSHDFIDQILIQVKGERIWQRGRICYNSRHIEIIIPYLLTSWLYILKFLSQDISLTYLPEYQWTLLRWQDFLIWEGLLFTIHQISWIPRIWLGFDHIAEKALKAKSWAGWRRTTERS